MGKYEIKSWKKLKRIKVELKDGKKLTFHTFSSVKRGNRVLILGGLYKTEVGRVLYRWPFYKGYTYECMKAKTGRS